MNHQWQYRRHEMGHNPRMRVRRPEDPPDVFTVISWEDFQTFRAVACNIGFGLGEDLDVTDPD